MFTDFNPIYEENVKKYQLNTIHKMLRKFSCDFFRAEIKTFCMKKSKRKQEKIPVNFCKCPKVSLLTFYMKTVASKVSVVV